MNLFLDGSILALFTGFYRSRAHKGITIVAGKPKGSARDEYAQVDRKKK